MERTHRKALTACSGATLIQRKKKITQVEEEIRKRGTEERTKTNNSKTLLEKRSKKSLKKKNKTMNRMSLRKKEKISLKQRAQKRPKKIAKNESNQLMVVANRFNNLFSLLVDKYPML